DRKEASIPAENRRRIPSDKVKVVPLGLWARSAFDRSVPFGFSRQPATSPMRVSARLNVAHVDRPIERERYRFEQTVVLAFALFTAPQRRATAIAFLYGPPT